MKLLDKYFGINEDFPEKQYEFFNTSFVDSISITAILSVSIILFIICLLDKRVNRRNY
jgi:hypothetical protein